MVLELRDTYRREEMSRDYRITQLRQMKQMLQDNQEMILDALWKDLHKVRVNYVVYTLRGYIMQFHYSLHCAQHRQEAIMSEYNPVLTELDHALANIDQWIAPKSVDTAIIHTFNSACVQPEPYGVVLIMSTWNYPLMLSLQPLIGAIAAGV